MSVSASPVLDSVQSFMAASKKMLINGEWTAAVSNKTFDVFNPATGEVIAHVAEGDSADIDKAVRAARDALESGPWQSMTPNERGKILWRIADLIDQHAEELAQLETVDNGMAFSHALGVHIPMASETIRYMAGWANKIEGSTMSLSPAMPGAEFHAYTLREPIGVVGQIIPWNAPLVMAAWKLAPALACGCTVVLKVAEQTPLSALRLGELMMEAGLPDGVVNIITGFGETAGAALAAHPDVDKIAFTGSTEVGKLIVQAASGNLKKVSLELGGKSPNVILKDANLEAAIMGAANGIFFNSGQVCAAGSRLFIEQDIFDDVTAGLTEAAKSLKVGDGFDADTVLGPLVSEEQYSRVNGYMNRGLQAGATALCGGDGPESPGYFVNPTVLINTDDDMEVVREEIFGPVVAAMPFDNIEQLAARANDTDYGLAAGVWTNDNSKAHRIAKLLQAGTIWVNCYYAFDPALPFGGYKQSGWGRECGKEVLNNYLQTKTVCMGI